MKKLLCIILLTSLTSLLFAQNEATEVFFHDLQGLEDSAGTTHLFYRLYQQFDEDYDIYEEEDCILWRNDVYHFDLQTDIDTLKYESLQQLRCEMFDNPIMAVQDFQFLNNDLNKWFLFSFSRGIYDNQFGRAQAYNESFFDAGSSWINKFDIVQTDTLTFGVYDFWKSSILIILDNDSLPSEQYPYVLLVKTADDDEPELYCPNGEAGNCFYGKTDSVLIYGQNFLSVDQHHKDALYFQRNDSLFWSDDLGKTMVFRDDEFTWSSMDVFLFGEEDSSLIAATHFKYSPLDEYFSYETGPDTTNYYQLLKSTNSGHNWEEVFGDSSKIYLSQILEGNGLFYLGNENMIYESTNSGEFITEFIIVEYPITGLYKKPDSNILYVLTKEELLEVNTESKETTTLKELPVSNEPEPNEIPSKITLHQNYPNPFNPSTRIHYELSEASHIEIHVYDYLGRRLQTLVDEFQQADFYAVTFNANGYSSGVYYYRLLAPGIDVDLSKKMILIK